MIMAMQVTRDFDWICPEQNGANCLASSVPFARANLFDNSHTQPSVGLTNADGDLSGAHLPLDDIRDLFERKRDLRFAFYDDGMTTKSDLYVDCPVIHMLLCSLFGFAGVVLFDG